MTKPFNDEDWPCRRDGEPMTFGEMTQDQRRPIIDQLRAEMRSDSDEANELVGRLLDEALAAPTRPASEDGEEGVDSIEE